MRDISKLPGAELKNQRPRAAHSLSYQKIAGGLASEMVHFLRSTGARESSPPFRLVILGNHGGIVFECEVGENWEVHNLGPTAWLQHSHFPATALLTDGSLLTRTFLIERPPLAYSSI